MNCFFFAEAGAISLISEPISCLTNEGGVKQEGSTWSIDNGCTSCLCFRGKLMCTYRECPPLPCKITEIKKGDCCRTCSGKNTFMHRIFFLNKNTLRLKI